jgi:hypothetical protein
VGLRGGSLGDCSPGWAEEWALRLEIPRPVEQWLHGPMGQGLECSTGCSFSKSWHGEAFHKLGFQSANVSALPGALPQLNVSPVSQQSPCSWSSCGLQLCPSHHLRSPHYKYF